MTVRRLGDLTWTELDADPAAARTLVVPAGSLEQHGPHLPFDTDLRIAAALAERLVAARDDAVLGPPIAVGASGEHESFVGTLSIGTETLVAVIVELVRSALPDPASGRPSVFERVVFVNGHGGNIEAFARAEVVLRSESRELLVWHPRVPDGDSHAGRTETSILLHLDPDCVRVEAAEPGSTARWRDIGPTVMAEGLRAVTGNGILGDPTGATPAHGASLVELLVDDLVSTVAQRWG